MNFVLNVSKSKELELTILLQPTAFEFNTYCLLLHISVFPKTLDESTEFGIKSIKWIPSNYPLLPNHLLIRSLTPMVYTIGITSLQRRYFYIFKEPRNRFQGIDSSSLCSLSPTPGLLRTPGIDSKEPIPPAYVPWRADTTTLFLLGS